MFLPNYQKRLVFTFPLLKYCKSDAISEYIKFGAISSLIASLKFESKDPFAHYMTHLNVIN